MYRPRSASRKLHLAAALATLALATSAARADETPAYWLAPVSGTWGDGTKWSTRQEPYNPAGKDYHAIVDASGAAYTVTVTGYANVGRVTLNSADAVLVGGMDARDVEVLAGTWQVPDQSTIAHARITASGPGRIVFTQGSGTNASRSSVSFWNVTLASDLTMDGVAANVIGTLTLDNTTLRLGRFGATGNNAGLTSTSSFTVAGTGTVELGGTGTNSASLFSPGFLTLAQGVTVHVGEGATARVNAMGTNYGTIQVDRPGTSLTVGGSSFNNYGTIRATAGTLTLDGVTNHGLIHVTNAAVNLVNLTNAAPGSIVFDNAAASVGPPIGPFVQLGAVSTSLLDQITWTGNSTLFLNAHVDNTGKVFDTARYGVTTLAGDLTGGTFTSPNPDILTNDYKFTNVTLASDLNVHVGLTASGNLTLDNATLRFDTRPSHIGSLTQTGGGLRGNGRLVVSSTYGARLILDGDIDPGIAIDAETGDLLIGVPTQRANLTNHGTITVSPGRTFTLYGGATFANQGLITLGDTATLAVDGPFPLASLGTVNRAANTTVIWSPTLVDGPAGSTIDLNATPVGPVELGHASFANVTLTAPGRTVNVFGSNSFYGTNGGSLTGVTLAANLDIKTAARFVVTKGLTLADASIHFHDDTDYLYFNELANGVAVAQTLGGAGELVFDAPLKTFGVTTAVITAGPLTIAPGITIRTGDGIGRIGSPNRELTNNGTISARGANHSITIDASLVNHGTVEAVDGARLDLVAPFTNTGTIRISDSTLRLSGASARETFDGFTATNATVEITGAFDNTNRTIDVHDPARGITLTLGAGGAINGGTVASADGTALHINGSTTLSNTTVDAPIVVGNGLSTVTLSLTPGASPRGGITVENKAIVSFSGARTDAPAVHAKPGAAVSFSGSTTKFGSLENIALDNARLSFSTGTQPTALFRPISGTNATVAIGGSAVLDNTNDTLVIGGGKLDWLISRGKITGGRIEGAAPDAVLRVDTGGLGVPGTLENVTAAVTVQAQTLLTIAGTFKMEPNRGAPVALINNTTLTFAANSTATLDAPITATPTASTTFAVNVLANAHVRARSIYQGSLAFGVGSTFALAPVAEGGSVSRLYGLSFYDTLTGATAGTLDLADVPMILDTGANYSLAKVRTFIASAYANGAWSGPLGITSSYAATHPDTAIGFASAQALLGITGSQRGTILGQADVPSYATLVRLTAAGDANLDGVVNFTDLLQLAHNYNASPTSDTWYNGDFNYDGLVNFADLLTLARNYNAAMPDAPWSLASPSPTFATDLSTAFAAAVPEPSTLAWTLLAPLALRRRSRHRP